MVKVTGLMLPPNFYACLVFIMMIMVLFCKGLSWLLEYGYWKVAEYGYWLLAIGYWLLEYGIWQ